MARVLVAILLRMLKSALPHPLDFYGYIGASAKT